MEGVLSPLFNFVDPSSLSHTRSIFPSHTQAGKRNGVGTMYFKDGAKAFTSDWRDDQRVDLDDEESLDGSVDAK